MTTLYHSLYTVINTQRGCHSLKLRIVSHITDTNQMMYNFNFTQNTAGSNCSFYQKRNVKPKKVM